MPQRTELMKKAAPRLPHSKKFGYECSCFVGLGAFEVEIEAGELHVGGLGDLDVAFGAVHDVDFVAEAFDDAGFVGSVDLIGERSSESFLEQFGAEDLRRLREDNAFARNCGGDESDILGEAAALYFFHCVHGGDAEDGGAALAGFFDDARDLFAGDEGADGVVDGDELGVIRDVFEGGGDGLLARGPAFDYADRLAKLLGANALLEFVNFVGAGGKDDVGDEFAGGEAAKSV